MSYTVDTLKSFRDELGAERPICLLLGMDAFLGLPQWHRWRELLDLAHVVVAHRPGWNAPHTGELGDWLRTRAAPDAASLTRRPAGFVRDTLRAGRDPKYLVPDGVRQIILETECYAESL